MEVVAQPFFDISLGKGAFSHADTARPLGESLLRVRRQTQGVVIGHELSVPLRGTAWHCVVLAHRPKRSDQLRPG